MNFNSIHFENTTIEGNPNQVALVDMSGISISIQVVKYLLWSYRETESMASICILLQYGWPYFRREFDELISSTEFKNGFSSHDFFKYVVNMDILEEFEFMLRSTLWKITIAPDSPQATQQHNLIRKQVQSLHLPDFAIDHVLTSFFKKEINI